MVEVCQHGEIKPAEVPVGAGFVHRPVESQNAGGGADIGGEHEESSAAGTEQIRGTDRPGAQDGIVESPGERNGPVKGDDPHKTFPPVEDLQSG